MPFVYNDEQQSPAGQFVFDDEKPQPARPAKVGNFVFEDGKGLPSTKRTWAEATGDTAVDAAKGVVVLGESVVGLTDLVTGNLSGEGWAALGYDPKQSKQFLSDLYSDSRKQSDQTVAEARGFWNTVDALVHNPSTAVGAMVESAPMMLGGAAAVRSAASTMLAARGFAAGSAEAAQFLARPEVVARLTAISGAAEGALTSGQIQENARQDGRDWSDSAGYAVGAGALTGAIGVGTSRIPGFRDAEVGAALAGMGSTQRQTLVQAGKEIAKGAFKEGVLEELPQSAQEQVFTNLALGKPWNEGVAEAAAQGMVAGAGMGGGMHTYEAAANRLSWRGQGNPNVNAAQDVAPSTGNESATGVQLPAPPSQQEIDQAADAKALRDATARVAELEIQSSLRPLTEPEVHEMLRHLQTMQGEPAQADFLSQTETQHQQAQQEITAPETSGSFVYEDEAPNLDRPPNFGEASIERTQTNGSAPTWDSYQSGDRVSTAQGVTGTLKLTDGMAYVVPDQVEGGAAASNGAGMFSVTPGEVNRSDVAAPLPAQKPSDFWAYGKARGFVPGELKKGTPAWTAIKADYDRTVAAFANQDAAPGKQSATSTKDQQKPAVAPGVIAQGAINTEAQATPTVQGAEQTAAQVDPNLQNRDRSRAASVLQMQQIAARPDYGRLGTSRTPDAGAPMVFAIRDDVSRIPQGNEGRADMAVMADGQRVPIRYAVVDARDVEPSHFADGRLNDRFNAQEPGTIKALNNGRTAGLRAAYEQGTAQQYRDELISDAPAHGVPVEAILRTANPILVRVYSEGANTVDMAAKSQGQGLGMSPTELARQDAPLMDSSVLAAHQPGDVTSAANRDFVRAFVGKLHQSGQDIAAMMTDEGTLSPAGRQRLQAALMQAAYGDADLVAELFDSVDTDIKAIGEALKGVAGEWAHLRDAANKGIVNPEADISGNLVQAVNLIRKARRERQSLYELAHQPDLLTGEMPDVLTTGVLNLFYGGPYFTRPLGRDSVVRNLRTYMQAAMATSGAADMFGHVTTPSEILDSFSPKGSTHDTTSTEEGSAEPSGGGTAVQRTEESALRDSGQRSADPGREAGADSAGVRENAARPLRQADEEAHQGHEANRAVSQVPPSTPRNEDVGEQLYANRRNFTGRGIRWEDVQGLNDTLKIKEVTKAKAWPRPDYEKLIAEGMPPVLARMVKQVYDGISAGPTIRAGTAPTDEQLKLYLDALDKVRAGLLAFVQDKDAVSRFASSVLTLVDGNRSMAGPVSLIDMAKSSVDAKAVSETLVRRVWPEEFQGAMRAFARGTRAQAEIGVLGANKALGAMQFNRSDFSKWVADLGKGWPVKREAWQVQGYRVLVPGEFSAHGAIRGDGATRLTITPKQGRGSWAVTIDDARLGKDFFLLVQDGGFSAQAFDSREAAIDAVRKKVKRAAGVGQDIRGTNIEEARRSGPARRQEGEDITSQRLMQDFGFRGVNFGREGWINQAERQAYLNQAFDGLLDLAEVLGVPPGALSLNGELGIAFGAQGKGRFAAHFVPGVNEINLTKTKGAGTLAHEFGHALDHYFAKQAGLSKSTDPFLSEHAGGRTAQTDGIRPEITQAFAAIRQAMNKRSESLGEAQTRRDASLDRARKSLDGWLRAARAAISASPAENRADLLAELEQHAEKLREGDTGSGVEKAGKQIFSIRVAAVRNLIKDATGRVWGMEQTNGLESNARYVKNLLAKQEADSTHAPQQTATQFKTDSQAVDREKGGKAYWSTATEMFARAFELYVHDRLSQEGNHNTFLTDAGLRANTPIQVPDTSSAMARGTGAMRDLYVYPVGKERETLRQAFDTLVGQIQTKATDKGVAMFSRGTSGSGMAKTVVLDYVAQLASQWANAPDVFVVQDLADPIVPQAVRQTDAAQRSGGAKGDPEGFFYRGAVYIVASQVHSQNDVARVLFHEALGHFGLRGVFGKHLDGILDQIAVTRTQEMQAKAEQYGKDLNVRTQRRQVAEEVLAEMAQTQPDLGFVTRAVAAIRTWMREYVPGFADMGLSDAEIIRDLILPARGFVERGGRNGGLGMPAFSRNTLGDQEPDRIAPAQQNAWTRAKAKIMDLTSPQTMAKLVYEFQDKYIDLKHLQGHIQAIGGTVTDLNDAYLGEELFHKRLGKRTEDFLADELKPLLAAMRAEGVTLEQLEQFLHARHAPEANAELARHNPSRPEIDASRRKAKAEVDKLETALEHAIAKGTSTKALSEALAQAREQLSTWTFAQPYSGMEERRMSLSGMSDAQAKAVMDALAPQRRKVLDGLAAKVDAINAKTLDTLEHYGLMGKAALNTWRTQFKYYVPLHRDEAHADSGKHPIGQGFSVKGSAAKSRVGSNQKVTNILAHIAMQREAALTRGEKNNVVKKLYLLAAQNPDEDYWSLDKPPMLKSIDSNTGFVRTMVDPGYKHRHNVVMVRIAGNDQAIVFNEHNPEAVRLAQSMKNLDIGDLHVILGLASKGTRWFASVNTQYNPVFGLINFARDVQAGLLNLSTTELAGKQQEVAANVFPAMRAIYRERRGKSAKDAKWASLWQDMQNVGGTTGYRDLYADAKDRANSLVKELNALDRGEVSKAAHAVVDWLSDYNETMENAVRLSAYKSALDAGMTKERAASLAKNLTVNFNRKGRQAREIGALYAFFNAAIQGTARMAETLKGPVGKRIVYGGVLLGVVNTLIGMAVMGGDGDDDQDHWDQIPEFIKERSIVIPLGREDYLSIPLPLGFHVFPNIGRIATEFALGGPTKTAGRQVGKLLGVMADAFNPLGGSSNLGQMVAPTVIDPAVALMQNRDWTGRPIYRENSNSLDPQPGHKMAKDSASTPSRWVAEAINRISGGTDYRPGMWSPTPDQLDYVVGQLTGGVGRELLKVNQTIVATATGDELPPYKIPVVGRLYGNTRGQAGQSEAFYANVKALNELENEIKGRLRNRQDVDSIWRDEPLSKLIGMGNQSERNIAQLRAQRRRITERAEPGYQERVREIDQRTAEVMTRLNQEVAKAQRKAQEGGGK